MLGDVLVSKPNLDGSSVALRLPTTDQYVVPGKARWHPSGLAQKLAVIGNRLAIGWSGTLTDARSTITQLYYLHQTGGLTFDLLTAYLQEDLPSYLGFLVTGDKFQQFGFRCFERDTNSLGKLGVIGTGANDELFKLMLPQLGQMPGTITGDASEGCKALFQSLALTGTLLSQEQQTQQNLLSAYGAGYEIVANDLTGFCKVGDIAYVFWSAMPRESDGAIGISRVPLRICKYAYTNDVLTIRTVTFHDSHDETRVDQWFDHIPPLYRAITTEEFATLAIPQFRSEIFCHHFLINNSHDNLVHVERVPNGESKSIRFDESDGLLRLSINDDWRHSIARTIREKVSHNEA